MNTQPRRKHRQNLRCGSESLFDRSGGLPIRVEAFVTETSSDRFKRAETVDGTAGTRGIAGIQGPRGRLGVRASESFGSTLIDVNLGLERVANDSRVDARLPAKRIVERNYQPDREANRGHVDQIHLHTEALRRLAAT